MFQALNLLYCWNSPQTRRCYVSRHLQTTQKRVPPSPPSQPNTNHCHYNEPIATLVGGRLPLLAAVCLEEVEGVLKQKSYAGKMQRNTGGRGGEGIGLE